MNNTTPRWIPTSTTPQTGGSPFRSRRWLGLLGALALSGASAYAGSFFIDFNSDPSNLLNYGGTLWDGTTTSHTGSSNWQTNGGAGPASLTTPSQTTNGPVKGVTGDGFLQITFADHACAGSLSSYLVGGVLFDDFDHGLIVQGFTFECDLRIGNGNPNPADGFSINYIRANDPVIQALNNGVTLPQLNNARVVNPAGGYYTFADNGNTGDASLAEEGTVTGLSVGFDMWDSGNYTIPSGTDSSVLPGITHDGIGLDIRVDSVLQTTLSMPNGTTQATSDEHGNALTNTDPNGDNAATDPTAIETGPHDGTGCDNTLSWVHLKVVLDANQVLNVYWKNHQILTNYQTQYAPSAGRLFMVARVGGNTANIEVDNVAITTIPATKPLVGTATGYPDGASVTISDSGSTIDLTKPWSLVITNSPSGTNAIAAATASKNGGVTTVVWHGYPFLFPPGSTNFLQVNATDNGGQPVQGIREFIVPAYSVPNATWAVAANTVGTTPGFRMKTWQSSTETDNQGWWALEQLAGLHGTNQADTATFTDKGFIDLVTATSVNGPTGLINMNYTNADGSANENGNFQGGTSTSANGYEENQWPGLAASSNGVAAIDHAAADIQFWIKFPAAGLYTLGVNSDDGFRLTTGPNPSDWGSLILGQFNGGRGASDTLFTFAVTNAGYYPMRLVWENGTGGANCEFFSVVPWYGNPGAGTAVRYLINDPDPTNTTGIAAYYSGPAQPAYVSWLYPTPGSTIGDPIMVKASITDDGTTVVPGSIQGSVDGTALSALTLTAAGGVTTVTGYKTTALAGGNHTAMLVYNTSGGGPFTNIWTYSVPSYSVLNGAWAVTGVDTTQPGFLVRPYQVAATEPNAVYWMEEELQGVQGDNLADFADPAYPVTKAIYGTNYFVYAGATNWINWENSTTANDGNYGPFNDYPNIPFPGSDGANPWNNSAEEVLCYLYFDHIGLYTMGVNSDDGFKVSSGPSPADWLTSVNLGQYNGGRGASDTSFSLLVTNPGYYPFRLAYENGGGGFDAEWYVLESTATHSLLNDPRNDSEYGTVKAYYSGPQVPAFVSMAEPYPGSPGGAVAPDHLFQVNITDGGTTVTPGSVQLWLNGKKLSPVVTKTPAGVTKVTMPAGFLLPVDYYNTPRSANFFTDTAAIVYSTSAGSFSNVWSFNVLPWGGLDPAWAVTGVDTNKIGFLVKPYKTSGFNNESEPNNMRWAEEQLLGAHGPNHADLSLATDNGYIDYGQTGPTNGVINWNNGGNAGDFSAANGYPDQVFPGSANANPWDNATEEVLCYMYFPAAGLYHMTINSDDGFMVSGGKNPKDLANRAVLGFYNGGKGSSDVDFFINVSNAPAYYPLRLLWENGGGGFNCEWSTIDTSSGTAIRYLLNDPDPTNTTGLVAYWGGPQLSAYVASIYPEDGSTGVQDGWVGLELKDAASTITAGSITMTINGSAITPVVTTGGGLTKISLPTALAGGSNYTVVVTYNTSAGGPFTVTWSFATVEQQWGFATLSTNLWTPLGSGSNSGFAMKVFQMSDPVNSGNLIFNGWQNLSRMADEGIEGYYGANKANLSNQTNNGELWWPGVLNFAQQEDASPENNGSFQVSEGFPDALLPGVTNVGSHLFSCLGYQARVFLEFPAAGPYVMGFTSDDGFRVTTGDQAAPDGTGLSVLEPAAAAGTYAGMYTTTADEGGNNGFGRTPPDTVPLIARAVICDPPNFGAGTLNNASALNGNVAVVLHNGNMENQTGAIKAAASNVLAIIVANNSGDVLYPGTRGSGNPTDAAIPLISATYEFFTNLVAAGATSNSASPAIVRLTAQDCSTIVGKYDNGRGTSDTLFTIQVPRAGIYPFRVIYENGTGGEGTSEFFAIDPVTGIRTLINDAACPVKAWITRNVDAAGALPRPVINRPTIDANGNAVISWTGEGELWESYSVLGPWHKSSYKSNPSAVVPNGLVPATFYRVRQY